MEIGIIKPVRIEDEMERSYLDYAMSVIVSRALPDVRDGLKPSQRRILVEMHADIDMDTVDWVPNYDNTRQEPTTLPGRFPNLICNGSAGIAVGMATSMPPHNLTEGVGALQLLIDNPEATVDDLCKHIK